MLNFLRTSVLLAALTAIFMAVGYFVGGTGGIVVRSSGTGCALTTQVITPPDLAAQIREWRREGVHCAAVFDAGALTGEVTFAVRIGYFR